MLVKKKSHSESLLTIKEVLRSKLLGVRTRTFKGIVHFDINVWYVLSYLKGIQDLGVFFFTVFSMLIFLGQTVLLCQSYNGGVWSPPQRACTEKSRLNMT